MDDYKEEENVNREEIFEENDEIPDECLWKDINEIVELMSTNPKQVLPKLKSIFEVVAPIMNFDFFSILSEIDMDVKTYLQIWFYFLTGNSKNEQFISKIEIIERFIDYLPDSFEVLTLLLEHVREQVVKFHQLKILQEIFPLSEIFDNFLLSRFLLAISTVNFELSCPKHDLYLFISNLLETDDLNTLKNILKAIENFAKISYIQGVKFSSIIVQHFASFKEK